MEFKYDDNNLWKIFMQTGNPIAYNLYTKSQQQENEIINKNVGANCVRPLKTHIAMNKNVGDDVLDVPFYH